MAKFELATNNDGLVIVRFEAGTIDGARDVAQIEANTRQADIQLWDMEKMVDVFSPA